MATFIAEYWLKILFGLICAGVAWFVKRWYKLETERREQESQKKLDNLYDKIENSLIEQTKEFRETDERIINDLGCLEKEMDNLKSGVLSIQKPHFKKACRDLLSQENNISLEQFEQITKEHEVYHNLGGNSIGDELFRLVKLRYEQSLNTK